jgi:plasmid maintenance system antidote protein VapI
MKCCQEENMKSLKYLLDLQEKLSLNDTAFAHRLGITQPAISNLKAGRRMMENELCVKVAMELGVNPVEVIMAADMDRAERSGHHSVWEDFLRRTQAKAAASVLIGTLTAASVINFLTPSPAEAAPVKALEASVGSKDFILCKIRQAANWLCNALQTVFSNLLATESAAA